MSDIVSVDDLQEGYIVTATDEDGTSIRGKVYTYFGGFPYINFNEEPLELSDELTYSDLERPPITVKSVLEEFGFGIDSDEEQAEWLREVLSKAKKKHEDLLTRTGFEG